MLWDFFICTIPGRLLTEGSSRCVMGLFGETVDANCPLPVVIDVSVVGSVGWFVVRETEHIPDILSLYGAILVVVYVVTDQHRLRWFDL